MSYSIVVIQNQFHVYVCSNVSLVDFVYNLNVDFCPIFLQDHVAFFVLNSILKMSSFKIEAFLLKKMVLKVTLVKFVYLYYSFYDSFGDF